MRPSQAMLALETLRNISSVTLRRKGVDLTFDDSQTVMDVYQQWLLLMVDLGYLPPDRLNQIGRRLWSDMITVDVFTLNQAFAECLQLIRLQTSVGFKGLCDTISRHLYHLVKDDVQEMVVGNVAAARRLVQLTSYTSRLSLNDIDMTQQLLDSYLEVESNMRSTFPEVIVSTLNKIIRKWIGAYLPGEIVPNHGPGGVAEHGRCSLQTKYNSLATDQKLVYAFGNSWWVHQPNPLLKRVSRTVFVPKSYKTFRTISMEPTTLQYFQQGVWGLIRRQVEGDEYLKAHIGFSDQSRNRSLAQQGSLLRNYATIDLSSASDSVSYELVKKLFKGTWLLRYLVTTRSSSTELPDGRIIDLKKFAPMGSSLCFPIETIIFASVCEHVTRVNHASADYSVYGDDIIVPTQCAETVMRFLRILGFQVNDDKSYYHSTSWFRESCGGEYCDGYDVTPMRVSRKYASRNDDVRLRKLIDKANEAYERRFRFLRYFYLKKLRNFGHPLLFSPTSILSDNYTNYHTKKRWNPRLQYLEVQVCEPVTKCSKKETSSQNEEIRLYHWLLSCYGRSFTGQSRQGVYYPCRNLIPIENGFESVVGRSMVQLRRTWVRKPFELSDQELYEGYYPSRGESLPHNLTGGVVWVQ